MPEAFSRACGVCYADAPATRAVLTACGHLVCAPCAETIADGGGRLVCPYCRANTGYVFVVEEKEVRGGCWETLLLFLLNNTLLSLYFFIFFELRFMIVGFRGIVFFIS